MSFGPNNDQALGDDDESVVDWFGYAARSTCCPESAASVYYDDEGEPAAEGEATQYRIELTCIPPWRLDIDGASVVFSWTEVDRVLGEPDVYTFVARTETIVPADAAATLVTAFYPVPESEDFFSIGGPLIIPEPSFSLIEWSADETTWAEIEFYPGDTSPLSFRATFAERSNGRTRALRFTLGGARTDKFHALEGGTPTIKYIAREVNLLTNALIAETTETWGDGTTPLVVSAPATAERRIYVDGFFTEGSEDVHALLPKVAPEDPCIELPE